MKLWRGWGKYVVPEALLVLNFRPEKLILSRNLRKVQDQAKEGRQEWRWQLVSLGAQMELLFILR